MSYLPIIAMNAVILSIIAYVFLGVIADQREHEARARSRRRIGS
jgi:hypothetical protein